MIGRGYIGKLNAAFLLGLYFVHYVSAHIVAMLSEMQAPDISRSDNSGRKCTKQSDTEYPTEFDLFPSQTGAFVAVVCRCRAAVG